MHAQIIWAGGNAGHLNDFNTKQNWSPQTQFDSTTSATLAQFSGTAASLLPNITVATSVLGLQFNSGATAYTLSATSSSLSVFGSGIVNNSASTQTISAPLILGTAAAFTTGSTGALSISGTVSNGGFALTLNGSGTGASGISGVISGAGALTKSGTGTWTLSGANTYTGATTISQGTIAVGVNAPSGSSGALGNASSTITLNDGSTGSNNTALTINATGVTIGRTVTVANSGSGTVTLGGDSTLTSGTASFTGNVTLNKSASLQAGGSSVVTFGTGAIGGSGGVTKIGTGTVTLASANTFSGATTVSAGTLKTTAANALASTASVTVSTGGILELGTSNTVKDTAGVTLSGGTILRDAGVSETFGNLNLTTASTINFGTGAIGTLTFGTYTPTSLLTVSNFAQGDVLKFSSDLTSSINNGSLFSFSSAFTSSWNSGTSTFTITSVPEPSAIFAGVLMLGVLAWPHRRRVRALYRTMRGTVAS